MATHGLSDLAPWGGVSTQHSRSITVVVRASRARAGTLVAAVCGHSRYRSLMKLSFGFLGTVSNPHLLCSLMKLSWKEIERKIRGSIFKQIKFLFLFFGFFVVISTC